MDLLRDAIRHNSWATLRLIEHLQSLAPETMDLSAEGTYGPIGSTVAHIIRAERAYLARLRGDVPQPGQQPPIDLQELLADATRLAQDWDRLLDTGVDTAAIVITARGPQTKSIILAQAINHGAEHRAHVCTVLGAHGLQTPALDPFAYRPGAAEGQPG